MHSDPHWPPELSDLSRDQNPGQVKPTWKGVCTADEPRWMCIKLWDKSQTLWGMIRLLDNGWVRMGVGSNDRQVFPSSSPPFSTSVEKRVRENMICFVKAGNTPVYHLRITTSSY